MKMNLAFEKKDKKPVLENFNISFKSIHEIAGYIKEINIATSQAFRNPKIDPAAIGYYGVSSIGFCLQKIILQIRSKIETMPNARMIMGTAFHEVIPRIIEKMPSLKDELVIYESRFAVSVENVLLTSRPSFRVTGHPDAYFPTRRIVLEFKTSDTPLDNINSYILEAYLKQLNFYAYALKAEQMELWMFFKLEDATNYWQVMIGKPNHDLYMDTLYRYCIVDKAVRCESLLPLTELEEIPKWECTSCQFIMQCNKFKF